MKKNICQNTPRAETHIKHTDWMSELARRTKSRACAVLWTILVLALTAAGPASALNINLTYDPDSTFIAAGVTAENIPKMKNAAAYAASQFTSRFSDPIDVNIKITAVSGTGTLGMGTSLFNPNPPPTYTNLRNAMVGDGPPFSADDATALGGSGSIPMADPITGAHVYVLTRAQAKALLGLANGGNDGTFTFGGGFMYTYDPLNRAVAPKIDFVGVAMHGFSEIMGRIGLMGQMVSGQPGYTLLDLFHYTGAGTRGLNNNGPGRFFSINNGGFLIKAFNDVPANGGDLWDWAGGTNDCFNTSLGASVVNNLSVLDTRVMDVIGYDLDSPTPLCTEFYENFDGVTAPAFPDGWVATNASGPAPLWVTSITNPASPPNCAFVDDPDSPFDKRLDTPEIFISSASVRLFFTHSFSFGVASGCRDGGVLEVSSPNINGGTFTDITDAAVGGSFVSGGYNGTIPNCGANPIIGRSAWLSNSGGYVNVVANPGPNVVGQTVQFRFRTASGGFTGGSVGWRIDNLIVQEMACPLQTAVSRKVHGGAGTFDITLPFNATDLLSMTAAECRSGAVSGAYRLVYTFDAPVTFTGASFVLGIRSDGGPGGGSVTGTSGSGTNTVTIDLAGVATAQRIKVRLSGINNGSRMGDMDVPMGVLVGDVSENRFVNATDVAQTKLQTGRPVSATNFRTDVNANGVINATDVSTVKLHAGESLPNLP